MPGKKETSMLQKELESFARRRNELTAARLQSFPGVLSALFGDDALVDPGERQVLAERVVNALLGIIAGIDDEKDRRIAEAIFVAKPEFYGKNVTERQQYIEDNEYKIYELYKNRRKRIVADVTYTLQRTLSDEMTVVHDAILSPEARRAARQLYRFAQCALVRVEAYGFCNTFAFTLWLSFYNARSQGVDPKPMSHGWLAEYCTGGERFHLTPSSRSPDSDLALWALVYCHRYLRVLLQDGTGRDYLRDNLPAGCWRRIQLGIAFQPEEIERTLSVLAEAPVDDACTFVDNLCQDSQGRSIHGEWLRTLCSQRFRQDNIDKRYANWDLTDGYRHSDAVGFDLLNLCILLQHAFPKDTLVWRGDESLIVILELIRRGLREIGLPDGRDSFRKVSDLGYDLASRRPPRYPWDEAGQVLWSDELPDPKLWTIPGEG